jgi:hypothetical protein
MLTVGLTRASLRLLAQATSANPTEWSRYPLFFLLTQSDNPATGHPAIFCLSIQLEKCEK